jgi:iron(III) transport system substrate-binding protein
MIARPPPRRGRAAAVVVATALSSLSCRPSEAPGPATQPEGSAVVYCSVDIAFARPILAEFTRRTGITLHPVFDTEAGKTTGLVNRLILERSRPRADVWWSSEIFGTIQLASQGILEAYSPPAAADIPPAYRDPAGRWTALGLRGRVIAYDPRRTRREDVPRRWADLTDDRYRSRACMADPRFGTTRGHMAVLLASWGEAGLAGYLDRLRANGCRLTDGNSQSVLLVTRGKADLAATDTDDVIAAQMRGESVDMVFPDLDAPGGRPLPGTLWIPCTVGLVRGAPRAEAGRAVVDFLVSAEAEEMLHRSDSRNTPVRPALVARLGVSAPPAAAVDYAAAAGLLSRSDQLVDEHLLP